MTFRSVEWTEAGCRRSRRSIVGYHGRMPERGVHEFGGIHIDSRLWPLILWEQPEHRTADGVTTEAFAHLESLLKQTSPGERLFLFTDLSRVKEAPPASQRKLSADFIERNEALQRRASVGGCVVVASAIMRGVLTAIFWMRPPPTPMKIVGTREEGILYGLDLLEADRAPLPEHLQPVREQLRRTSGPAHGA